MPDERDPFADLGADEAGRRRRKAIGDRLAERDQVAPEQVDRRPEVPRPGNKYAWVVGILMLMGIGVLLLTTALPNTGEGIRGPQPGELLRPFAAPLATSNVDDDSDSNVCQLEPCPEGAGRVPACDVRSELVLNLCDLRRRAFVLTFMVTAGADCEPQVDRVERVRDEFPGLEFAVLMSGNDPSEAGAIVERRGWRQPVGVDRDGAVVNLYGIGICPVTVFALPGGVTWETNLGNLTEGELRRKALRLERRMVEGPGRGERLPAFAAPLASEGEDVEANVCQEEPCAREEGPVPACDVDTEEVLNLCELRRRPLVLTLAAGCAPSAPGLGRVREDFPQLNFATVVSQEVADFYGIGTCPTTIFARRGGRVVETVRGEVGPGELRQKARELVERSG